MFRLSNNLILLLNFASLLVSVPIILSADWLGNKPDDCDKWLEKPVLIFGICIFLLSLMGLIGACCSSTGCLWMYLFFMYLLMIALFAFSIFSIVVVNKSVGKAVEGIGYDEYKLGDYSNWLQNRVENKENWKRIKSCLQKADVCNRNNSQLQHNENESLESIYRDHLSAVQSGCCNPSRECGFRFQFQATTVWIKPENGSYSNKDCEVWDNKKDVMCFDCESCKAGVIENVREGWIKVMIINAIVLFLLSIIYSVGCCAYRNDKRAYYNRHYYY